MTPTFEQMVTVFRTPLDLNAKPGDRIMIMTDTAMNPALWQALSEAARRMDIEPVVTIMEPRVTHATNPDPTVYRAAMDLTLALRIYLTSTAMAHAPITNDLVDANQRFILMEELTPEMLDPNGPAGADYHAMFALGTRIADRYTKGKNIRVACRNGTNLTASIEGRPGRSIAGMPLRLRPDGGGGCAFPDGEAHVCPVEGTGEGTVVFDLTAHSVGKIVEPLRLTVKKGMVTSIDGGREAQIWRDIFAKHGDAGSYNCPAEISIGLNDKVRPTGSMRTDKKMYATSHVGVGDTVSLGGTCHARLRLEGVILKPHIEVDGEALCSEGKILV